MKIRVKHGVEVMLRPKVEFWSATISLTGAVMAVYAPWSLMMAPSLAYATAGILGYNAYINYRDFYILYRYQGSLRRQSLLKVAPDDIRISDEVLTYGKGFRWKAIHTQRYRDTRNSDNEKYIDQTPFYLWARKRELAWERTPYLNKIARLFKKDHWLNPVRPLPPIGGEPQIHGIGGGEEDVTSPLSDRNGHTLVLGMTRVGKSRLLEILITQDIRRGDVVIIFDPKGDPEVMRRTIAECKACGREKDLLVFHLGFPSISARYNGIGHFGRVTEVATRTANQLNAEGSSSVFKEFFWRFTNIIAQALVALGRRPDYVQLAQHIQNIEDLFLDYYTEWLDRAAPEDWRSHVKDIAGSIKDQSLTQALRGKNKTAIAMIRYAQKNKLFDGVASGLKSTFEYDKTYFDKIVASGLPLLEKLVSGRIAELISPAYDDPADNRPVFDWGQVIRQKKVIYIGLDAMSDKDIAGTVGNTMFADLVSVAGEIYKHGTEQGFHRQDTSSGSSTPINVHADEVNELMGDEFIPMVNKGGGSGLQITAYTQTLSDIKVRLGDEAKAGQAIGNFSTLIMLRVKEMATSELLTDQLPPVEIKLAAEMTGAGDSVDLDSNVDFTSQSRDTLQSTEVGMIHPSTVMALPKGQAFLLKTDGTLWKIRIPLPDSAKDRFVDGKFSEMAKEMERTYTTSDSWWTG